MQMDWKWYDEILLEHDALIDEYDHLFGENRVKNRNYETDLLSIFG